MSNPSPSDTSRPEWSVEPPPEPLRKRNSVWIASITSIAALGLIGWEWADKVSRFASLKQALDERYKVQVERLEAEEALERAAMDREMKSIKAAHQARMSDPASVDGSKALELHDAEWSRRRAHDPQLVQSLAEHSLLEMEQLGADKEISAQEALEKVATLAAPPRSRIEVTPSANSFAVKVAYRMAALTTGEVGAVTKHTSKAAMRAEILRLSAQVARDLFTYCGSRGISSVSLTCNHTTKNWIVPQGATEEEKSILRSRARTTQSKLLRVVVDGVVARNISNWSRASEEEVLKLLKVDFDGLDAIEISSDSSGDNTEAADPLSF